MRFMGIVVPEFTLAAEIGRIAARNPESEPISLLAAQPYSPQLATRPSENFTVASRLLPPALRQHFYNVYAYCRWADDLADESASPEQSIELLDRWERELEDCYRGRPHHAVFVALADTIREFGIPARPFKDL